MRTTKTQFAILSITSAILLAGCTGSEENSGSPTIGGATSGVPNFGGAVATGGATSSGGNGTATQASGNGGSTTIPGTDAGGTTTTSNGGTSNVSVGGTIATGGTKATGGTTATGGTKATGGTTATGGTKATGGTIATGGTKATGGTTATGGGTSKPKFHAFLLLGQSNMAGYPKAQAADKTVDSRIRVLGFDNCSATGRQTDKWATAVPPLHECWNSAIGPGDYFAKTLLQSIPAGDTIGLVPCAISGEKIETFLKSGGTKYSWILARAKLAQTAGGIIEGILFHQGESNNGDSTWPGKVKTLVTDLRTDLGLGNVPFLAGELLYGGSCAGHNTLVNQLPSVITNAFVISASGLVEDTADTTYNLHFDHDSQVTFGKRYGEKMKAALGW